MQINTPLLLHKLAKEELRPETIVGGAALGAGTGALLHYLKGPQDLQGLSSYLASTLSGGVIGGALGYGYEEMRPKKKSKKKTLNDQRPDAMKVTRTKKEDRPEAVPHTAKNK